jgi:chromosome segregation ATPase
MARGGLYKSDVKKARDSLIAQGKHPSLDAVRIALGNTGSKSTIHRFLKELEEDEGEPVGDRVSLTDALTDLVHRLSEQMHQDAHAVVAEAEARFKTEQTQLTNALGAQREESARFAASLRQSETLLSDERTAHDATRREVAELRLTAAAAAARLDGLVSQLDERDQRITSLEQKHSQAREALEHFRVAAKEQREQEARRHDHALQAVQLELRQAADTLTAKNHELQQLHRDNGRLLEQKTSQDRELLAVRGELSNAVQANVALSADLTDLREAARQHAAVAQQCEQLVEQLGRVEASLREEVEQRRAVEAERNRLLGRLQTLDDVMKRIERRPSKATPPPAGQDELQVGMPLDGPSTER